MSLNDVAFVSVKGNDDRIHIWYMSKDEAINVLKKNTDLTAKVDHFKSTKIYFYI